MSPAPFLPDTEQLLDSMLGHVCRVRAIHPDFAVELDLVDDPGSVRLEYDEKRAPRCTLTLVVVQPDTQAELDRLDPRRGVRAEIDLGYVRQDTSEDVATIANLGLRRAAVDYAARTVTLTLASDEALVVDASPAVWTRLSNVSSHAAGIQQLLNECIQPPATLTVVGSSGPAVTVDPVTDRWEAIQDLADRLGSAIYDDGTRAWHLEPVPTLTDTPDVTLETGSRGTVLVPEASLARDDWFNYITLRYRWRNSSGADQQLWCTAYLSSGDYAVTGPAGKRIMLDDRSTPTTVAQGNAAAAAILARQLSRSRSFTFQAIAAYWVRPGMTAKVTLPGATPELHLVSRVTFQPLLGTMTVDTRLPDKPGTITVATTTPAPAAPADPTPPPTADPAPPPVLQYITEWTASDSRAYRADGQPNSVLTDRLAQGYAPGSVNGNQQSLAVFLGANSTTVGSWRGEVGKTPAQALTGATIQRVQVLWTPVHTWYTDGGSLRCGWVRATGIPATFKAAAPRVTVTGVRANTPRWVDLTGPELAGELKAGRMPGFCLGPGVGTDPRYYVLTAAHNYATTAWRPRVRVTYTK